MDKRKKEHYYLKRIQPHDGQHKLIALTKNKFTVGRHGESNYNIPYPIISRCHAIFKKKDTSWTVKNCSSSGTFINETPLPRNHECGLEPGYIIQFGQPKLFLYEFRMKELPSAKKPRSAALTEEQLSVQKRGLEERLKESESLTESLIREKNTIQLSLEEENKRLHMEFNQKQTELEKRHEEGFLAQQNLIQEKEALAQELQSKISEMKSRFENERSALELKLQNEAHKKDSIMIEKEHTMVQLQAEKEALEKRLQEERILSEKRLEEERRSLEQKLSDLEHQRLQLQEEVHEKESTLRLKELQHTKLEELQMMEARKLEEEKSKLEAHLKKIENDLEQKNMLNIILEGELELRQDVEDQLGSLLKEKESLTEKLKEARKQGEKVSHLEAALNQVEQQKRSLEKNTQNTPGSSKEIVETVSNVVENELQCAVCNELFITATMLNCSHTFCKFCIDTWKKNKKDCPNCRTPITSETKSLVIDNFIEKIVETLSSEMKQRRQEMIKEREAVVNAAKAAEVAAAAAAAASRNSRRSTRSGRGRGRGGGGGAGPPRGASTSAGGGRDTHTNRGNSRPQYLPRGAAHVNAQVSSHPRHPRHYYYGSHQGQGQPGFHLNGNTYYLLLRRPN